MHLRPARIADHVVGDAEPIVGAHVFLDFIGRPQLIDGELRLVEGDKAIPVTAPSVGVVRIEPQGGPPGSRGFVVGPHGVERKGETDQRRGLKGIELMGAPVKGDCAENVARIPHRIGDADEGRRFPARRNRLAGPDADGRRGGDAGGEQDG